jgi:predicted metalloprotease with PDZ domain
MTFSSPMSPWILTLSGAALSLASCMSTEYEELPPHVNLSAEELEAPLGKSLPEGERAYLGLSVEAVESDSLEKLEVLPGARVRAVESGGPAARSGLEAGDVILSVNGTGVRDRDGFEALLQDTKTGETLALELRRGTTALEAKVQAAPAPGGAAPVELYRVDPLKSRAGYRTVVVGSGAERRVAAEVVKIFPRSPLPEHGLVAGDRILALQGRPVSSAQDLVRRFFQLDFGDAVELTVLRAGGEETLDVRLWAPRRRISALQVPVLFTYESSWKPDKTSFYFLDFYVFALFGYRREEGEREVRLFSLFRFRSGYGELVEEPGEGQ